MSRPKTGSASKRGRQSQSTEPLREIRAAVRVSPTRAYSAIGAWCGSLRLLNDYAWVSTGRSSGFWWVGKDSAQGVKSRRVIVNVCPAAVTPASPERIWTVLTTPERFGEWTPKPDPGRRIFGLGLRFQLLHRLGQVSLSGLRCLAVGDRRGQSVLAAVRQAVEVLLGLRIFGERLLELRRNLDVALFGVKLDVDVDRVAGRHAGCLAHLVTDAEHEGPTHRSDGAPIGVLVDRHFDERTLGGAETLHHFGGDLDSSCCLAREQDLGAKTRHRAAAFFGPSWCEVGESWTTRMWLPNGSRIPKSVP